MLNRFFAAAILGLLAAAVHGDLSCSWNLCTNQDTTSFANHASIAIPFTDSGCGSTVGSYCKLNYGVTTEDVFLKDDTYTTMIIDQASYDYWSTHSNTCVAPCADVAGLSESSASSCITEGPAELPHQIAAAPQNYYLIVTCDNLSSGCGTASKPVYFYFQYSACVPDCSVGCQPDGCGHTCPPSTCGGGDVCFIGSCCTPNCAGKCGSASNGCGGTCSASTCGGGQVCNSGTCCTPNCAGKCGGASDGCGGTCSASTCGSGDVCNSGTCCTPDCAGKCGSASNGCGGTCSASTCGGGQVCNSGACCTPNCAGKCGGASDGCGGTCTASCGGGQVCNSGTCCAPTCDYSTGNKCNIDNGCGSTCASLCFPNNQTCVVTTKQCCTTQCLGKACDADNGCGASCGCSNGGTCYKSECCVPRCECGSDDGCGGTCDQPKGCAGNMNCIAGQCVERQKNDEVSTTTVVIASGATLGALFVLAAFVATYNRFGGPDDQRPKQAKERQEAAAAAAEPIHYAAPQAAPEGQPPQMIHAVQPQAFNVGEPDRGNWKLYFLPAWMLRDKQDQPVYCTIWLHWLFQLLSVFLVVLTFVVFIGHFARDNIDPGCDVPSYFPFVLVLVQGLIGAGVWLMYLAGKKALRSCPCRARSERMRKDSAEWFPIWVMFWLVVAFGFVWAIISLVKLNASSCAYSSPNYEQPLRYLCIVLIVELGAPAVVVTLLVMSGCASFIDNCCSACCSECGCKASSCQDCCDCIFLPCICLGKCLECTDCK